MTTKKVGFWKGVACYVCKGWTATVAAAAGIVPGYTVFVCAPCAAKVTA